MARRWRPTTLAGSVVQALERAQRRQVEATTVSIEEQYRDDPVGFARDILGIEPIRKQCEILEALVPRAARVSVRSSHKAGKSTVDAIAAIWFYATREAARVICLAPTHKQLQDVLYREIKRLLKGALVPIPGEVHRNIQNGVRHPDLREIMGVNASDPHNIQGYSGPNILFIVDEASGVDDEIFEALEGNSAGVVRWLLTSNPTRTQGYLYRSHNEHKGQWSCFALSAFDSPNITGEADIPGLATQEWVDRMRETYGETSPFYVVRVLGDFCDESDGQIITAELYQAAVDRWATTPAIGSLYLGVDPAGPGAGGDSSAFCVRVGPKVLGIERRQGLESEGHAPIIVGLIRDARRDCPQASSDLPTVVIDASGLGARVAADLIVYAGQHPGLFRVVRVRYSDKAAEPLVYKLMGDQLWGNTYDLIRRKEDPLAPPEQWPLAFPHDDLLREDLLAQRWVYESHGLRRVTEKRLIRKLLGRSTDSADALTLACWARAPLVRQDLRSYLPSSARSSESRGPARSSPYGIAHRRR